MREGKIRLVVNRAAHYENPQRTWRKAADAALKVGGMLTQDTPLRLRDEELRSTAERAEIDLDAADREGMLFLEYTMWGESDDD